MGATETFTACLEGLPSKPKLKVKEKCKKLKNRKKLNKGKNDDIIKDKYIPWNG